jgi:hypothetical protein
MLNVRSDACRLALVVAVLALPVVETRAGFAEDCSGNWKRPFICRVEMRAGLVGERSRQSISSREMLELGAGATLELEVRGVDQFGAAFPIDRSGFVLDGDRDCRSVVTVNELASGRFRIAAGNQRGRCTLYLRVPGNANLEWPIRIDVKSVASEGYTDDQAELVAHRLYRAILGRDADPGGLSSATAEIARGRLSSQVESMLRSGEFRAQRATIPANALLDSFYQGLLGRTADAAGVSRYLREVEKGRSAKVVIDIVRSKEFEDQLLAAGPGRRR